MVDRVALMTPDLIAHCDNVRNLCEKLYYGPGKASLLRAAEIHDIGKYFISNAVLDSSKRLSLTERMAVDMHSLWGYYEAKEQGEEEVVCQLILLHHGISKVSQPALITGNLAEVVRLFPYLMAADIYSAVRENRSYHASRTHTEAVGIVSVVPDIPENIKIMLANLAEE